MTEATQTAEERVRDAVALAGGTMKSTAAALMRTFGEGADPNAVERRLLAVGVRVSPALHGLEPMAFVVLHAASDSIELEPIASAPSEPDELPNDQGTGSPEDRGTLLVRNLSRVASELPEVFGRDREIGQVIELLSRRLRGGVMLVGPPGVGKRATLHGVVKQLGLEGPNADLEGAEIVELQITSVLAALDPSEISDMAQVIVRDSQERGRIIFVPDFHIALAYGSPGLGLVGGMRQAMDAGTVRVIGSIGDADWAAAIRADPALEHMLEPLRITEPDRATAVRILEANYRSITGEGAGSDQADLLRAVDDEARRRLPNRAMPGKAIDLLDRVLSRARCLEVEATPGLVADVIAEMTGVPTSIGPVAELQDGLAERLKGRIIGQGDAIDAVVHRLNLKLGGFDLRPERPNGVFLFSGPSGVGKTQLARQIAIELFGSEDRVVRLDMSEHSESHHVSQIIGAPPGYVGFEQGSPLFDRLECDPFCLVLLDEIEKAHPAIHRLFLQVFDAGVITTAAGRRVYLSDAVIVMTSNIDVTRRPPGFTTDQPDDVELGNLTEFFPPEFVNRIDAVCRFRALDPADMKRIIDEVLLPNWIASRASMGLRLRVDADVVEHLAERGCSRELGARELERVVEAELLTPVMNAHREAGDGPLTASMSGDEVIVRRDHG